MSVSKTLQLRAVRLPLEDARPVSIAPPLFRLRTAFWATSCIRNRELWLYPRHLELHVPHSRSRVVHRAPFERISRVELVEGRIFTDIVFATDVGTELVAPGIRNRELAAARTHLSMVMVGSHPTGRG